MTPELKAAGFNTTIDVAREQVGVERFDRFVEGLPPNLADYMKRPRLATAWLPLSDAMEVFEHILNDLAHGDLERVFEIGRQQFKRDLSGIYKVFVRLGSVSFIAKRTAAIYGTYSRNAGMMRVVRDEDRLIEIEVSEHPFPRPGLWHYLRGTIHGAAEASGVRAVKTVLVESDDVRGRCLIRATWV